MYSSSGSLRRVAFSFYVRAALSFVFARITLPALLVFFAPARLSLPLVRGNRLDSWCAFARWPTLSLSYFCPMYMISKYVVTWYCCGTRFTLVGLFDEPPNSPCYVS